MGLRLRILLTVLFGFGFAFSAQSKELPQGQFALIGDLFPGIQEGYVPPVYVHLTIDGDTIEWGFLKAYEPTTGSCNDLEKYCTPIIRKLTQKVRWRDSGIVELLSSEVDNDPNLIIDRAEFDNIFFLFVADQLVNGASLVVGGSGFELTPKHSKFQDPTIFAIPLSVQDMRDALAVITHFDVYLNDFQQCVLSRLLALHMIHDRTQLEQEVLLAMRFFGQMAKARARAFYVSKGFIAPNERRALTKRQTEARAWEIALSYAPMKLQRDSWETNAPSDAELVAHVEAFIDRAQPILEDKYDSLKQTITVAFRKELLAAARFANRYASTFANFESRITPNSIQEGIGYQFTKPWMEEALCSDITLSIFAVD